MYKTKVTKWLQVVIEIKKQLSKKQLTRKNGLIVRNCNGLQKNLELGNKVTELSKSTNSTIGKRFRE